MNITYEKYVNSIRQIATWLLVAVSVLPSMMWRRGNSGRITQYKSTGYISALW
jgi:hypothetical protein